MKKFLWPFLFLVTVAIGVRYWMSRGSESKLPADTSAGVEPMTDTGTIEDDGGVSPPAGSADVNPSSNGFGGVSGSHGGLKPHAPSARPRTEGSYYPSAPSKMGQSDPNQPPPVEPPTYEAQPSYAPPPYEPPPYEPPTYDPQPGFEEPVPPKFDEDLDGPGPVVPPPPVPSFSGDEDFVPPPAPDEFE